MMRVEDTIVQIDRRKLRCIVDGIVRRMKPRKIVLFGSRAMGLAQEESDIDVLVVQDRMTGRTARRSIARELSKKVGLTVQIVPMRRDYYEETKDVIGGIAYPAAKYGVVVYEAS